MNNINLIFEEFPVMETERFILRRVQPEDCRQILDIYSDDEVLKHQPLPPMKSLDEIKKYIEAVNSGYDQKSYIRWGIADKNDDKIIGLFAVHHLDYWSSNAQVGYILNRKYWRQGIMSEVMERALDYIFNEIKLNRLGASINPDNIPSIKLAEKFGFKREGLMEECTFNKKTGEYEDRMFFGLLRKNYK